MSAIKMLVLKTLVWRILSVLATGVVAWIVVGDFTIAAKVMSIDFFVKTILYMIHERIWLRVHVKHQKKRN